MDHFRVASLIPFAVATTVLAYCYNTTEPYVAASKLLVDQAYHHPAFWFCFLFTFRYLRFFVHLFSVWFLYKPTPVPAQPDFIPADCTVILPTVDPLNPDFAECIESCLKNGPGEIIIVTVGNMVSTCRQIAAPYRTAWPNTRIRVFRSGIANKRAQVALAIPFVQTRIIVLLDDHVFWPSLNFLKTALAPFEDENVGAVGTNKRVRRTDLGYNWPSFFNMLGALYLERHNYEIKATNAIDGGIFVLSGRTSLIRANIVQNTAFIAEFTNERFFFNKFGPLNADDDNCITRWLVKYGWDIKIQACNDAMIETTLGTYPKFMSQCLRWVRTTWRSNSASLFTDRTVWRRQPWCVYAVYITSFFNFALFNDALMMYTLMKSPFASQTTLYGMITFIFFTKLVKLLPYFVRHPRDIVMLPGYFAFAYYHSLMKLWAGLTFYVTVWGGRDLSALDVTATDLGDNEIGNGNDNHGHDDGDDDNSSDDSSDDGHMHPRPRTQTHQQTSARTDSRASRTGSSYVSSSGSSRRDNGNSNMNRRSTRTPWGEVTTRNPSRVPANLLQSQDSNPMSETHRATTTNGSASFSSTSRIFSPQSPNNDNYSTGDDFNDYANPADHMGRSSITADPYVELDSPIDYRYIMSNRSQNLAPLSPYSSTTSSLPSSIQTNTQNPTTPTPQTHNQLPTPASTPIPTLALRSSTPFIKQPYQRTWTRGPNCDRLHYDGQKLRASTGTCLTEGTWTLPRHVVPGRARF